MWDVVGMNRNQADGALALDRAKSFNDRAHWQTESATARDFDGDEVAVSRTRCAALGNAKLASKLLLVDRHQSSAAAR